MSELQEALDRLYHVERERDVLLAENRKLKGEKMNDENKKPTEQNQERGLVVYESRDGQEIRLSFDTVRRYLVSGHPEFVTDQEIVLYMGTCKARGLNPFKKDCYLVKYTEKEPAATIVAIDFYRSRARAQHDCVGWKTGILLHSEKTGLEYREGSFIMQGENLVGGWFKARPSNWREDYTWTIPLAPFIKKTREGQVTQFWQTEKQSYMICKVAESQGLHRLWPDEFQGLQLDDEFNALRDVSETRPEPLKIPQPLETAEQREARRVLAGAGIKPTERKADEPKTDRRNDNGVVADSPKHADPVKRAESKRETKEKAVEKPETPAEKSQDDLISECLLWIEHATEEQLFADDNWLMNQVKHLKGIDNQLKVLRPFNNRRQALQGK